MDIFASIGSAQGLQPFALSKIAIALSIRKGQLESCDLNTNTDGLELNRQTIFGEYDVLFKSLIAMSIGEELSDEEFFPLYVKAHLDRGARLLSNEMRYGMNFYENLLGLDDNL
jgi:DNA sulfur modification protein DndE